MIKNMKSKMTTNSQLLKAEPKKTETKTNYANYLNRNRITEMEITSGVMSGEGEEEEWGEDTGHKKHKWWVQNRQREVKNSIGNGEAKELICMTHGHELRWGMGNAGGRGMQGGWE